MKTTLITGGTVREIVNLAAQRLDQGDHVVLFHEFPNDSIERAPAGAEVVFNVDPSGLSTKEIAEIYGAQQVINLDGAREHNALPQHRY